MNRIVGAIVTEERKVGMKVNIRQAKQMRIITNDNTSMNMQENKDDVNDFTNVGSIVTNDGNIRREVIN